MHKYNTYINFVVTDDGVVAKGILVTPRISEALEDYDELVWNEYLRLLHESTKYIKADVSDL